MTDEQKGKMMDKEISAARQQITDSLETDTDEVQVGDSHIFYVRHPAGNYWEMGEHRSSKYHGAGPLVALIPVEDILEYIEQTA